MKSNKGKTAFINDSAAFIVNENRKSTFITYLLSNIEIIEKNTLEGDIMQYLANIYSSMVVLEDFIPELYTRCREEVGIDYKKVSALFKQYNPYLSPSQITLREALILMTIKKVLKKLPALKRPTISRLAGDDSDGWYAVNTIIKKEDFLNLIPILRKYAQGLVVHEPRQILPLEQIK